MCFYFITCGRRRRGAIPRTGNRRTPPAAAGWLRAYSPRQGGPAPCSLLSCRTRFHVHLYLLFLLQPLGPCRGPCRDRQAHHGGPRPGSYRGFFFFFNVVFSSNHNQALQYKRWGRLLDSSGMVYHFRMSFFLSCPFLKRSCK